MTPTDLQATLRRIGMPENLAWYVQEYLEFGGIPAHWVTNWDFQDAQDQARQWRDKHVKIWRPEKDPVWLLLRGDGLQWWPAGQKELTVSEYAAAL